MEDEIQLNLCEINLSVENAALELAAYIAVTNQVSLFLIKLVSRRLPAFINHRHSPTSLGVNDCYTFGYLSLCVLPTIFSLRRQVFAS